MKHLIILLFSTIFLYSCDPDVPGEGITLPQMEFEMQVYSDSSFIKLGDTIYLYSSIPSKLNNGIIIEEGEASIDLYMGYSSQIPIEIFGFETVKNNEHTGIFTLDGEIVISPTTSNIVNINALPVGDSIKVRIGFIPKKVGTYTFYTQSLFYEGKIGKTRTNPTFKNSTKNFDVLWRLSTEDLNFSKQYLFAVYE